jgi:RNA polymerase sigma-70 factor, ECF subfamily
MVSLVAQRARSAACVVTRPRTAEERLRALFESEFDFVWRTLRRLGLDAGAADDAAQETFVIAARKLASIEVGAERSFLLGSAVRIAANVRRTRAFRDQRTTTTLDEAAVSQPCEVPLPDAQMEHRETLARLDRALHELPDDLREVLVLTELDALSQPEIAALLGIAVGTVASRLRRARRDLAGALSSIEDEPRCTPPLPNRSRR